MNNANNGTRNMISSNTTANGAHVPSRYTAYDLARAETALREALQQIEGLRHCLSTEQATKEVTLRALDEGRYQAKRASQLIEDALLREEE